MKYVNRQSKTAYVSSLLVALFVMSSTLFTSNRAGADPCGMVPPVQASVDDAIKRVGAQKTYLFYKDGIESFVVRPGFEGKVDNFGMLIPFPNVPSIRKVPNNVFPQLASAIDPPEIDVRIRRVRALESAARPAADASGAGGKKLKVNQVDVKSQEAVGMYQTAVLEAGSAEALKRWMDEHGYTYPNNMDEATQDYVEDGWCFVAVKARVGSKNAVNPKPGIREADPQLPEDATFDGNVQAMGFRFRSDRMVAPMRLSAYNDGKLHNITYVLTDEPKRINNIPEEQVRRQVSGERLYKNVTEPLPVRVIGGTWDDLSENRKERIQERRDPDPKNGRARELFRSDLLAAHKDRLVHGYEQDMKALLDAEEALNLRGEEIDRLNREYLSSRKKRARQRALKQLKGMTLTVVDGEFPREVLKRENLTFSTYRMPADENTSSVYNARKKGPEKKDDGTLYRGESPEPVRKQGGTGLLLTLITAFLLSVFGLITMFRSGRGSRAGSAGGSIRSGLLFSLFGFSLVFTTALGAAADVDVKKEIKKLTDRKQAPEAVQTLVKHRNESLPKLIKTARRGMNIRKRSWSIVALSRIGGDLADHHLEELMNDAGEPDLVRTLAAAGRVRLLDDAEELNSRMDWIKRFPALERPFRLRFREIAEQGSSYYDELLLKLAGTSDDLQKKLSDRITALGPERLAELMTASDDTGVRRLAASYLGTLAQQGKKEAVVNAVRNTLSFTPGSDRVPWQGGPLFLPRIQWTKSNATPLVRDLLSWMIRANELGNQKAIQQIHNNIRSIRLRRAVGYNPSGRDVSSWLKTWKSAMGNEDLKAMLKEQDLLDKQPYKSIVN